MRKLGRLPTREDLVEIASRPSDSAEWLALDASARFRGARPKCTKVSEAEAIAGAKGPRIRRSGMTADRLGSSKKKSPWPPADRWGGSHGVLGKCPVPPRLGNCPWGSLLYLDLRPNRWPRSHLGAIEGRARWAHLEVS